MPVIHYARGLDKPGPRVFLAIPTGSGSVSAPTLMGVFEAAQLLPAVGIRVDLHVEAGNCHVDDARNSAVREFLKTDCTDLVFIDDDVGFDPDDLRKLILADADVVGGVYPKKEDVADFPVFVEPGTPLQARADGLVEVHGLPTGFLKIRRHVLEKLAAVSQSFIGQAGDPLAYHVIFERIIKDGKRWSGDYGFCQKWRAIGGKLYTDPEMRFTHTGNKTWGGSLGAFWRKQYGVDPLNLAPHPKAFVELFDNYANPWAAKPALLSRLWSEAKDGIVLETGSGLTSYVMARAGAEVHCLEHDPEWAAKTRKLCEGLNVTVHEMPLVDGWYAGELPDRPWTLLVNDGPPRALGDRLKLYDHASGPVVADDVDEAHAALLGGTIEHGFCVGRAG